MYYYLLLLASSTRLDEIIVRRVERVMSHFKLHPIQFCVLYTGENVFKPKNRHNLLSRIAYFSTENSSSQIVCVSYRPCKCGSKHVVVYIN